MTTSGFNARPYTRFKAGDRVRRNRPEYVDWDGAEIVNGRIYTVERCLGSDGGTISLVGVRKKNYYLQKYFTLVESEADKEFEDLWV